MVGVIHALAGMANAAANGWPMICVAGSSELGQDVRPFYTFSVLYICLQGLGAFQESLVSFCFHFFEF